MSQRILIAFVFLASGIASSIALAVEGTVVDPSQRPIPGAQVAAINRVGVVVEQITDDQGRFNLNVPSPESIELRVTAPGFETTTVRATETTIQLALAPQTDSVRVTGSAIDVPASLQGSSVSVITSREIRERNEAQAFDLLRELPGVVIAQSGARGAVASMFVRGSESKYNLVQLNGLDLNSFYYGGLFDFAHIPSDFIEEIEVARGPQSAVYGSYAIGSAVNFITRSPENGPTLDVVAEGGTHYEHRFSVSGSGMVHGVGLGGSVSRLDDNGPVPNSDYRNENVFLSLNRRWSSQNLFAFGDFNSNETGEPGPYGSNPQGLYPGLDLISRSKNNTSGYGVHYGADFTSRFRQDIFAGFFLNNSFYKSPFGDSFNKDLRGWAEARESFSVTQHWILAAGAAFYREELKNTYVTDSSSRNFPLRRDNEGIYLENRFEFRNRLFINAGVRGEIYQTPLIPADMFSFPPRPEFPASTVTKVNPKLSGVYLVTPSTRLHSSFATGIRPPGGSDLAFTDNPLLLPERTISYDAGVEQRLFTDRLSLNATWFHNRYKDLIVSLGGSLATLSHYYTDNLSNALSEGAEISATLRPARWISIAGNYTWLETKVLSLNGTQGLVQQYYYVGQPLLRRPKQSGSLLATFHYRRLDANLAGYFRGQTLDVEPNYGAFAGLYWNPGYQYVGINLNYRVARNFTVYANLRNALNQRYEEIYGFPSPLLNVVAGVKWSLARTR